MAEIGLVTFAQVAMQICETVLLKYRSKFSKHVFTQPQLLTILCLMRYADWTFREAEVRLAEHSELRGALGLTEVPDYSTVYRFMRRMDEGQLQAVLAETARRMPGQTNQATTIAVDATGLAPGAISTFFINRVRDRGQGLPWRHYLKWLIVVDVARQIMLAQHARQGPVNDSATLRPLVGQASRVTVIGRVLADAEFDSERNHHYIRVILGADSVIPVKRGKPTWKVKGVRAELRANFPTELYGQRALVETVFSVVKRKLSAKAPGRSLQTQRSQAFLLGLAYNFYRLKPCHITAQSLLSPVYQSLSM